MGFSFEYSKSNENSKRANYKTSMEEEESKYVHSRKIKISS